MLPTSMSARTNSSKLRRPPARIVQDIGYHLTRAPGRTLLIDYGYSGPASGDTLQAVKDHKYWPPLEHIGTADWTAHVDFTALARAARREGAAAYGPIGQGDFLERLGIGARAEALISSAPEQAETVRAALNRLTAPEDMGTLFKALCLSSPHMPPPPGFELDRNET